MSKHAQSKSARWVRPELKKLSAGSAEANATGIDDGGPVGNARS
ncbi:MAG TPA: hypothetical protein VE053_10670 [Allosphingosinicella sp.]|nr:hypothetical protein [Allosphingosinicella sp.]